MNELKAFKKNRGFSLTESLIALIVLSVGLIALVKFQGGLVGSGGLTKARGAAVTLAQEKVEDLRKQLLDTDYTSLADTPVSSSGCAANDGFAADSTVTGTNASYTRCHKIISTAEDLAATPPVPAYKTITAKLTWADPQEGTQSIVLSSIISWNDPAGSAYLASTSPTSGSVEAPSGNARLGGDNTYSPGSIPGDTNGDGTSTYTHDGYSELVDEDTGEVLLTSVAGTAFASISGRVYVTGITSPSIAIANATFPVISDAGVCTRTFDSDNGDVPYTVADFSYYDYACYAGSTWYGNVGLIRTDNANSNDRVCIGDPTVSESAVLSTTRTYRGYESRLDDNGDTIVDDDGNTIYYPSGLTSNQVITGHHFLVTNITGSIEDTACIAKMTADSTTEFTSNPDEFFCLTDSCDAGSSLTSITIQGAISGGTVSGIETSDGGVCTITGGTSYSCPASYTTGSSSWSGTLIITAAGGYDVCTTNPLSLSGLATDSTGNDLTLATTGSCPSDTYTITGSVSLDSAPAPDTNLVDTSLSLSTTTGSGTCTYDTQGTFTSAYTCTISSDFTGSLTITGTHMHDVLHAGTSGSVPTLYSYGSIPTVDVSGQNFVITKN